ncbi:MAG: formimidoylglutamase [Acidobacteriota bacterium]
MDIIRTEFLQPCPVKVPKTASDDPRVGHLLGRPSSQEPPLVAIVGFPCDIGVGRNAGRRGAAEAPAEIRRYLYRLTPDSRRGEASIALLRRTLDLGDVLLQGLDLEEAQERLATVIAPLLGAGVRVIILGGGHETAYGHFLGWVGSVSGQKEFRLSVLNWDAHADVRPTDQGRGHSGSPFRQMLEHAWGSRVRYQVAGLLDHCNAVEHVRWLAERGSGIRRSELDLAEIESTYRRLDSPLLVSFDLDAVDQAWAPGVSAPSTGGLTVAEWLAAAWWAGRWPGTRSIDVVELNPRLDRDGQTARLAALTVWKYLSGLASLLGEGA